MDTIASLELVALFRTLAAFFHGVVHRRDNSQNACNSSNTAIRFYFSTGTMKRDSLDVFPELIVVFLVIASVRTISLVSCVVKIDFHIYYICQITGHVCHGITAGLILRSSGYLGGSTGLDRASRVPFKNFSEDCTYEKTHFHFHQFFHIFSSAAMLSSSLFQ
jgi:hypothetical protein